MTSRPRRLGATTNPAPVDPVDLGVDLETFDVTALKELQHRIEVELARIEPSEPPGASRAHLAEHGDAPADPERSRGLRRMLVAIDDRLSGLTDTADSPTGE